MKNIQKYFKKKDEDRLDLNTLSTVSHEELSQIVIKFHSELKDASHMLEIQEESSKQLKKELSKSTEELKLYKTHCEDLQSHAQKIAIENDSLNTLVESKNQESKYFREKNAELEKLCENSKNFASVIAELDLFKNKNKESIDKISVMNSEKEFHLKEKAHHEIEIKILKERYEDIVKKILELEGALKVKTEELQKSKSEAKTTKSSLKDIQQQAKEMEAIINGKTQRISELEANCKSLSIHLSEKASQLETVEFKYESLNDTMNQKISEKESLLTQYKEKFEHEVRAKIEENTSILSKNLEDYKIKITSLEIERSQNFIEIQKISKELQETTAHLKSCQESLESVQKKRELAKEEVLKLTQKLENSHERVPVRPIHSILPQSIPTPSVPEYKAIQILRVQLDTLYKSLMDLMLTANTIRDSVTKLITYQIPSDDFSKFEKDLNKVVMNVHEASENPNFIEQGPGWMGKISNWAPSKLLSCMSSDNRMAANNPPEKRRASYKGFF